MSCKLFKPENKLTLLNLLTPVRKTNFRCASASLRTEYRFLSPSRMAMAVGASVMLSRMGLSYSSINTTARWPVLRWAWRNKSARLLMTSVSATSSGSVKPKSRRLTRRISTMRRSSSVRFCNTPSEKLMRITGYFFVQSHCVSAASPVNNSRLPSNNSFSVSKNRLLPKRRGRLKK